MRRLVAALLAAAAAPALAAAEVVSVDVTYRDSEYRVTIDALLEAPPDAVYAVFTDYPRWSEINDLIKESEVLETLGDDHRLVRTRSEGCVLGFCKQIEQVQWMRTEAGWRIRADVLPERSDLRSGWATTRLSAAGRGTRFQYEMSLVPDFWVPPLIGPLVLKRKLRKQAIETAVAVELAAQPQ